VREGVSSGEGAPFACRVAWL